MYIYIGLKAGEKTGNEEFETKYVKKKRLANYTVDI